MPLNFQPFHERSDSDAWPEIEPSLIEDGRTMCGGKGGKGGNPTPSRPETTCWKAAAPPS